MMLIMLHNTNYLNLCLNLKKINDSSYNLLRRKDILHSHFAAHYKLNVFPGNFIIYINSSPLLSVCPDGIGLTMEHTLSLKNTLHLYYYPLEKGYFTMQKYIIRK